MSGTYNELEQIFQSDALQGFFQIVEKEDGNLILMEGDATLRDRAFIEVEVCQEAKTYRMTRIVASSTSSPSLLSEVVQELLSDSIPLGSYVHSWVKQVPEVEVKLIHFRDLPYKYFQSGHSEETSELLLGKRVFSLNTLFYGEVTNCDLEGERDLEITWENGNISQPFLTWLLQEDSPVRLIFSEDFLIF